MIGPIGGIDQVAGVVDCKMDSALRRQDPVASVLAVLVRLVFVHDTILSLSVLSPEKPALVFILDLRANLRERTGSVVLRRCHSG